MEPSGSLRPGKLSIIYFCVRVRNALDKLYLLVLSKCFLWHIIALITTKYDNSAVLGMKNYRKHNQVIRYGNS